MRLLGVDELWKAVVVSAILAGAGGSAVSPQTTSPPKPNFSGRWIAVSPANAAGQEQWFEQTATTLTISHDSEGGGHRFIYNLDGTESRSVIGGDIVTLSRAVWKGDQLTITSTTRYPDGRELDQTQVLSLDAGGQLVIEFSETMDGKVTKGRVVCKKR